MTISVSTPHWDLDATLPPLMLANLSHLGLIKVVGEQGRSFIHGQVTTDISSLATDQWRWGAHCDPKGKMLASFRTFAIQDALFMLMPKDAIEVDLPQLQKYAVFSKATLSNASAEWTLLGVAGEQASQFVNKHFGDIQQELTLIENGAILKDAERFILVLTPDAAAALVAQSELSVFDASAWQALEIAAGYPNLAASHASQYVPQMCNLQAVNGISFNKGCYMGQETIARMKYRGGNKRALYILRGHTNLQITLASGLEIAMEDSFRRGGQIIEFVQRGNQVLLTAVLPNDTANDTQLRFADDEQSHLTIQALPYSLDEA
ncbi:tRNA-modifying protein YgfZ [Shewanella sp. SM101]|uniref:tRNA-modifying protein YgfZ n=1 Tax=Shewanella TaxID=22 RepID=UPI0015675B22|nr:MULTISPECIES: tRNA-modifying protein YgfZ [unclassified Shewanella]MBW3515211.1 tRNA-modifying protein YgfZ [Shewanella sp. NKUCC01_JLK]MCU8104226.1 tRNA-modifying protein YgfZ [Shewanella sp. SM101]NRD33256.1 tRNA-modifying protein YgfZ [Shewanella sp. DC2-4]